MARVVTPVTLSGAGVLGVSWLAPVAFPGLNPWFGYVGLAICLGLFIYAAILARAEEGKVAPNMPLHLACRYLAEQSKWASARPPERDEDWPFDVSRELQSALSLGVVASWGYRRAAREQPESALSEIPDSFWRSAEWEYPLLSLVTAPTSARLPNGSICYRLITLNDKQVYERWPKLKGLDAFTTPISRISRQCRAQGRFGYDAVWAEQDQKFAVEEARRGRATNSLDDIFGDC